MKCVLVAAVAALFAPYVLADEDETPRVETVAKLKSFTDRQLRQTLEKLLDGPWFRRDSLYEPCLNEIVHSGGKTWEAFLKAKLES